MTQTNAAVDEPQVDVQIAVPGRDEIPEAPLIAQWAQAALADLQQRLHRIQRYFTLDHHFCIRGE